MVGNFFVCVLVGVLVLFALGLFGGFVKFLLPAFTDIFDDPFAPKYIPCVTVSASIDGGLSYNEINLKRIPLNTTFFLKFDVSIRRRGLYIKREETFKFAVENTGINKLIMNAIEYSGTDPNADTKTFDIVVAKNTGKNTIIFKCRPPLYCTTDTLFQIKIKAGGEYEKRLKSLDKTIALVFVPGPSKPAEPDKTATISVKGELELKTEK